MSIQVKKAASGVADQRRQSLQSKHRHTAMIAEKRGLSIMNWTYPIKTNEFITYQEKLCGRTLKDREREMTIEAAGIINEAYEDGKAGFPTGLYPREPNEFLSEAISHYNPDWGSKHYMRRYILTLVWLTTVAWERGQEDAMELITA